MPAVDNPSFWELPILCCTLLPYIGSDCLRELVGSWFCLGLKTILVLWESQKSESLHCGSRRKENSFLSEPPLVCSLSYSCRAASPPDQNVLPSDGVSLSLHIKGHYSTFIKAQLQHFIAYNSILLYRWGLKEKVWIVAFFFCFFWWNDQDHHQLPMKSHLRWGWQLLRKSEDQSHFDLHQWQFISMKLYFQLFSCDGVSWGFLQKFSWWG